MSRLGGNRVQTGKSFDDQLRSSVSKLSNHPNSVDILITSLRKVSLSPHDVSRVPVHNKNFQKNVLGVPGGVELLQACGYVDQGQYLVLKKVDVGRIQEAKRALEHARDHSISYQTAKESQDLDLAIAQSKEAYKQKNAERKEELAELVPEEPPEGAAGNVKLCFHFKDKGEERKIWRRFESHDTLKDLINYVGSLKEFSSQRWQLVNVTMSPREVLSPSRNGTTLQNLDLWPVGHVLVEVF